MLIILYIYLLNPEIAKNIVLRFSPKAQLSKPVEFDSFQKKIFLSTLGSVVNPLKIFVTSPYTKPKRFGIIILFVFVFQMRSAQTKLGGDWYESSHYPEHWLVSLMYLTVLINPKMMIL